MALAFVMNRRSQVPAEDSPAFGAIAERFRRAGELERAVSLCEEGLLKFPEHLSARVTLGWALLDLGKYKEARTELERVVKRAPDNLAAIRGLAELHDRMENADASDLQGPDWLPVEETPVADDYSAIKRQTFTAVVFEDHVEPHVAVASTAVETEAPYDPALREVVTEAIAAPEFQLAPDLVTPRDALLFEDDLQSRLPFDAPAALYEVEPVGPQPVSSFENELEQFMRAIGPAVVLEDEPVVEYEVDLPVIDLPVLEVVDERAPEAAARTAEVSMAVRHEARPTPGPALVALERFLRRVETRKLAGRLTSVAS